MRLLVSWVRDFVDVQAPPEEIAAKLALRGFEVAAVEPHGEGDAVIDFEVTANRPDCLSVVGLAREIATAYDLPLRLPPATPGAAIPLAEVRTGESDRLNVRLEASDLCPRYAAAIADVSPAPSPAWLTSRLTAAGIRPINSVVDVTNYVLLELGHPMHTFDLARLAGGELCIRRALPDERLSTLDGVERTLAPDMLVIADGRRAQAVAGVMGGADSEVSEFTQTIAFESAYFDPPSIRRTSKRLGLKTEASSHFERGSDVNAPVVALQRALALMKQIGAGQLVGSIIDRYPQPRGGKALRLRRNRLSLLLGLAVPDAEVARILGGLGLTVSVADDGWDVIAPTFRVDLLQEVDLVEEVGRHYGFDKIVPTFPPLTAAAPPLDPRIQRDRMLRRLLTAAGVSEAVTFGFIEASAAQPFVDKPGETVAVANPLSAKVAVLRPSLLPGLIDAIAHNRRHGRRDVALFEIGAWFTQSEGETRGVGMAWTGALETEHWAGGRRDVDFFDAKGIVERVCRGLGARITIGQSAVPYLVPGLAAVVEGANGPVGVLGLVSPALVDSRGAPRQDRLFVAQLDLNRLTAEGVAREEFVRPLPRYPSVIRDLSIVVSEALPAVIIHGTIHATGDGPAPLVSVGLFDRYAGKGVPAGHVSVSLRLTFQADDRTLTDAEVQQSFNRILGALAREHGAVQR